MEESLSQEHPSGDVSKDWMFSERDIVISDTVLGKGAFGEVRVAKWRNIDVAAKRLHGLVTEHDNDLDRLQFQNADIVDSFREEMVTLSKLRHPNLVLFLGVGYNPRNRQPTTILTELLSGSLYDLLEVHKIKLTLPEILDISLDVASGLEYLHSTNPQIVHRDISAKNILLGGNHAKIADLGQAKVFGSTALSRQTAMPGAMAYSAPEVLTGKYTAKIDIFSYGILLIQMCSGEYPRLDRREEQHKTAASKFSPLSQLLSQTIEYQPNDRPTASRVCEILREVRNNDRYYPPARRQPPQSDIGTLARRWLEETVESRCGDLRIALEQTSRRVHVEEQRWRDEAERVDKVFFELKELKEKVLTSAATITRRDQEITHLSQQITQLRHENEQKSQEIQSLLTEKDQLKSLLSNAQKKTGDLEVLVSVWRQEKEALKREQEEMRTQYSLAKQNEFSSKSSEHQLKFQLELQMDQCRELEMRLEQTLSRWRAEKEQVTAETERCTRLRETCVELVEKDQRRKEEIDRLMSRLSMYNSLPLPEEIKARFRDQERDIERLREEREEEREERRRCEKGLEELREEYEKMKREREEEREEGRVMRKQMGVREERERHLEEMVDELDEEMQRKAKEISMLEREKKSLMEITDMVREELAAAKDEVLAANAARRRAELDRNPRGGGAAAAAGGGGGGGGRSQRSKRVPRQQQEEQQRWEKQQQEQQEQEQEGSVGGATRSDEDSDSHSSGEEEEEDEEEGRDLFAVSSPLLSPTRRPLSAAASASASAGSTSLSVSSSGRLEEISDPDTRQRILHDQEKLRRYSINTRLKKVRSGELGTAEANAIKENTASRFHSYGSGNFGDLVKSASSTHEHLLKLQDSQQRGEQEDPLERQREQDSQAKGRILAAGERGGVEKIIECIWEHLDCEHTIWRGARALRELFVKDEVVRQRCVENKCEEALIAGLTAYPSSALVQTQTLRTLGALVFGSDLVRRHCGEKGALRRVVIALQLHSHDEQVVLQACTALTNLCHNSHDNRGRYLEANGTEPLLAVMSIHLQSSVKVQRQACWALLTLAGSDEVARVIVGQGGDSQLMRAMGHWKHDAGVQQFACWAICNLALADEEIKQKMRHSGILEMCHIALETHESNLEVVRQARQTIAVMGTVAVGQGAGAGVASEDTANTALSRPKSKRKLLPPALLKPVDNRGGSLRREKSGGGGR